jgi:hypothetical protein
MRYVIEVWVVNPPKTIAAVNMRNDGMNNWDILGKMSRKERGENLCEEGAGLPLRGAISGGSV